MTTHYLDQLVDIIVLLNTAEVAENVPRLKIEGTLPCSLYCRILSHPVVASGVHLHPTVLEVDRSATVGRFPRSAPLPIGAGGGNYEDIILAKVFSTCNFRCCMRTLKSEMCNV